MLQCRDGRRTDGQNDIGRERDQFRRKSAIAIGVVRAPTIIDLQIATFGPPELLQRLMKRLGAGLPLRMLRSHVHQHTDPPHRRGLLRARRERAREHCPAKHGYEIASPQSINSSARAERGHTENQKCAT